MEWRIIVKKKVDRNPPKTFYISKTMSAKELMEVMAVFTKPSVYGTGDFSIEIEPNSVFFIRTSAVE